MRSPRRSISANMSSSSSRAGSVRWFATGNWCNRRGDCLLPDKADLIKGRVQGHADGFGFVIRDDKGPDVFLGPRTMREVLHGDRVIVRIAGSDRRGRPEGRSSRSRARQAAHRGSVLEQHGVLVVVPEDRRIAQDILLAPALAQGAQEGGGGPGGHGGTHRAAHQVRPADRQDRRSARQLRRLGDGDRDCASQARPALRVLERGQGAGPRCRWRCARRISPVARTSATCRS